ncbi:MAG TPA: serine hydrolase [Saprospiraceae bacterium]|jgi:CubicO group peptidase (beta-lactamase class C family)|nr:serine hydrolase [Saprospiraceae bacterium]HMT70972.1 serine hydrolase [Saprospiraceae bacterium]
MTRRKILILAGLIIGLTALVITYFPMLSIATGYAAKKVCTCTFLSKRDKQEIVRNDLYFSILSSVDIDVNVPKNTVTTSIFGLAHQTAVFRKGIGCILLNGEDDYHISMKNNDQLIAKADTFWHQIYNTAGTDTVKLDEAVNRAFDLGNQLVEKRTTAVLVIHHDTLIAEKYAPPFHAGMAQLGWSMTKSIMNAFAGILIYQGKLQLDKNHLFDKWAQDSRSNITIKNLLQMNSALEWEEIYTSSSDATQMLYNSEDVSAIPLRKQISTNQGESWYYSSGTSNILSKYYRNILGDSIYHSFLNTHLFGPLGMHSALIETDETGTFIGSSYGYATPRDWAKFGLLYLHDGVWNGQRLLPEGWTAFTAEPAKGSNGKYGAHFWLNKNGIQYPDAPHDMIIADGYQGQFVFVVPSHDAVIVRMGTGGSHFDVNAFLKEVLATLPKKVIQ